VIAAAQPGGNGERGIRQSKGTVMRRLFAISLLAAAPFFAAPVLAHHSFAAEFDMNQPIKLRGTVTEIEFINPHSCIHIDVKKDDGSVEKWAIEGGTPNTLFRMGVTQKSLPVGTEILVDGYRSRDGANRANGRDITLPDGKKLFLGGSAPPQ
jgi:hypothetical protein